MTFLETSVLIRYFTRDDAHKADRCEHLLKDAERGRVTLFVTHLVLAEVTWVLEGRYAFPKAAIVESLRRLMNTHNIVCEDLAHLEAVFELYVSRAISFVDAYHAVFLPARGITTFYSYDTDFDHVAGITRREP